MQVQICEICNAENRVDPFAKAEGDVVDVVDLFQKLEITSQQNQQRPPAPMNQGNNAADRFGQDFAKGLVAIMMPTLKETMKGQLRTAITTPSDDGKDSPLGGLSKGSWSDFNIQVEGKMALVSRKEDPSLKFKMVKSSAGHWKIVQMMIPLREK